MPWRRWWGLPVLTRATLALRYVEGRSWAEVSWTTGLSERATRRRAERGLAALAPGARARAGADEGGAADEELERLWGALRARTAAVHTVPVELSTRAARVSRSRREWRLRAGAAVLLVTAVGVPLAISVWPATWGLADVDPSPDDGTTLETALPEGFRTEAWRGVEVGVPDDWGYGSLAGWCRDGDDPTPRVDRPGEFAVEGCDPGLAPGVQFRPEGESAPEVPDGLVAGERVVEGDVVLVVTPEEALTQQVLATVRAVERADSNGCAVQRAIPRAGKNFPAVDVGSTAVSVCRYAVGVAGPNLVQSERLSVIDSVDLREAVDTAPTVVAPQGCLDGPGEETVALITDEGDLAWIHLGRCQGMDDETTHLLTDDVLFWALSPGWDGPREELPLPDDLRRPPAG